MFFRLKLYEKGGRDAPVVRVRATEACNSQVWQSAFVILAQKRWMQEDPRNLLVSTLVKLVSFMWNKLGKILDVNHCSSAYTHASKFISNDTL